MPLPPDTREIQDLTISSAEEMVPVIAPETYRPRWDPKANVAVSDRCFHEPFLPMWRRDYTNGSNRLHFVLLDRQLNAHMVEQTAMAGPYEASGPGYCTAYESAYDAFWRAENESRVFTDPRHHPDGQTAG